MPPRPLWMTIVGPNTTRGPGGVGGNGLVALVTVSIVVVIPVSLPFLSPQARATSYFPGVTCPICHSTFHGLPPGGSSGTAGLGNAALPIAATAPAPGQTAVALMTPPWTTVDEESVSVAPPAWATPASPRPPTPTATAAVALAAITLLDLFTLATFSNRSSPSVTVLPSASPR